MSLSDCLDLPPSVRDRLGGLVVHLGGLCNNNNRIQRRNSRMFTISSLRREPPPTRTLTWSGRNRVQITCNTSSAYHVQHVVLRATWYEVTAQLLSLTECESLLFELYFIG